MLTIFKKIVFVILGLSFYVNSQQKSFLVDYDVGKERLIKIMFDGCNGVNDFHKRRQYAQVQNVFSEIRFSELVRKFKPYSFLGKILLNSTLQYPLSCNDEFNTVFNRQKTIKMLQDNVSFKSQVVELLHRFILEEESIFELFSLRRLFVNEFTDSLEVINFMQKNEVAQRLTYVFEGFGSLATLPIIYGAICHGINNPKLSVISILAVSMSCYISAISLSAIYKKHLDALHKMRLIKSLYSVFKIAQELEDLFAQHDLMQEFSIGKVRQSYVLDIIDRLKENCSFNDEDHYLFLPAMVDAFIFDFLENDIYFAQIFASIAEVDCYNAISDKMIALHSKPCTMCFSEFVDDNSLKIDARNFWNIVLYQPVPNDLHQDKSIILSGPNAGGKSTVVRSMLKNIILSQTYGVAAASSFVFTPFDVIMSFLNVTDDIHNGLSLFNSEVKRAQDLLNIIKSSKENHKKIFYVMDEWFTSTSAREGEKCAYEFIKKISKFDNGLFIYTTNFNLIKDLAENNDVLINYKLNVPVKNKDGFLVYPFTLSPGANYTNVALDIAQEAGLFD